MRPKRLPSNLYQFRPGTGEDRCVLDCITSLQNGADLLWIETEKPHIAQIAGMVEIRDPALVEIAEQHEDPEALAAWIRTLPQRDDDGRPCDGPKVTACLPPQRLRIPADDPNCVVMWSRPLCGALE